MKSNNWQFIIKAPIYINFKKHVCPNCNTLVNAVKTSKTVWLGSDEAKKLRISGSMIGGGFQRGQVKVIWQEFECPQCNQRISVERMKEFEGIPL